MSTPNRVPAGTPTAGQFAPDQHSDAGLALAVSRATETEVLSHQLDDCYNQRDDVNARISQISAKLLATQVTAKHPNAATVVLDATMSDSGDDADVREVVDAEGTVLLSALGADTTDEEYGDLDDWSFTARGIQLGREHTEQFLDTPEQPVGQSRTDDSRHGRLDIGKALNLR